MKSQSAEKIKNFLAKHKSLETTTYKYKHNKQLWQGLLYGSFTSQAKAKQALAKLPKPVQLAANIHQWDSIQKVMLP